MKATLYFDGSAEPTNPGICRAGAVLILEDQRQQSFSQLLGIGSNNTAEYGGLLLGLRAALSYGITSLDIYGDSKLVVNCINDNWGSKQAHLTLAIESCRLLLGCLDSWSLTWIPREKNVADAPSKLKKDVGVLGETESVIGKALAEMRKVRVKCKS